MKQLKYLLRLKGIISTSKIKSNTITVEIIEKRCRGRAGNYIKELNKKTNFVLYNPKECFEIHVEEHC